MPFTPRDREFHHASDSAFDNGAENNFTEALSVDDAKGFHSLLYSLESASESD